MTVKEMIDSLALKVISGGNLTIAVQGGYVSDLLSNVMANAKQGDVWVTMQAHQNIIAVASLIGLSAVVVAGGVAIDPETLAKADRESINLLTTEDDSFTVVGLLYKQGVLPT